MTAPSVAERPLPLVARDLGEVLRRESPRSEERRNLTDEAIGAVRDAGLLRFWVPEVYGGAEVSPQEGIDTIVELARHDGPTAWVVFIANTTALLGAYVEPEWARRIWGDPSAMAAGFAQPMGRARQVDGGLRVTGQWQWGSGTQHATWIGGGALVVDDAGAPAARGDGLRVPFVFFEPDDVTFLDTWHTLGMRGTGSTDYATVDAFVPEGRWARGLGERFVLLDRPLYRFSFYGLLASSIAATGVGLLQRAVDEFRALAMVKSPQNSRRTLAERSTAQIELARAEATALSAKAFIDHTTGAAWEAAVEGRPLDDEQRRLIRLADTDATQRCADAVGRLHRAAGGEAVYQRNPLERLLRDANVTTQHAMCAERIHELCGRIGMGLETDTSLL